VHHFVASTNVNDEVPQYLKTGIFEARPSRHTLSNAMDVGNPSNFERMLDLFDHDVQKMKQVISGYAFTDTATRRTIEKVKKQDDYILCPHTAIAYAGLKQYLDHSNKKQTGVFLSSAHPCKFPNVYPKEIWEQINIPDQATMLKDREKQAIPMTKEYKDFKEWLMG